MSRGGLRPTCGLGGSQDCNIKGRDLQTAAGWAVPPLAAPGSRLILLFSKTEKAGGGGQGAPDGSCGGLCTQGPWGRSGKPPNEQPVAEVAWARPRSPSRAMRRDCEGRGACPGSGNTLLANLLVTLHQPLNLSASKFLPGKGGASTVPFGPQKVPEKAAQGQRREPGFKGQLC